MWPLTDPGSRRLRPTLLAAGEVGLEQIRLDGSDVYWIERRSKEGGRKVIVRRSADGQVTDMHARWLQCPHPVHEYGGGELAGHRGWHPLLRQLRRPAHLRGRKPGRPTRARYSRRSGIRSPTSVFDAARGTRLISVREDHSVPDREAVRTRSSPSTSRRPAPRDGAGAGQRLLRQPPIENGKWDAAVLGWRGTIPTCLGTVRGCTSPT